MSTEEPDLICSNCGARMALGLSHCPNCGQLQVEAAPMEGSLEHPSLNKGASKATGDDSADTTSSLAASENGIDMKRDVGTSAPLELERTAIIASPANFPRVKCISCGTEIDSSARFCPQCGADQNVFLQLSDEEIDLLLASDDILALIDDEVATHPSPAQETSTVRDAGEDARYDLGDDAGQTGVSSGPSRPARSASLRRRRIVVVPAIAAVVLSILFLALTLQGVIYVEGVSNTSSAAFTKLTFVWEYEGSNYTLSVSISKASYDSYADQDIARGLSSEDYSYVTNFITTTDSIVIDVAGQLSEIANDAGMSSHQLLSMTLAFVQYITYSDDASTYGTDEYWAYPVETLYHETGDCEDKSFLYATLVEAMNMDAVVLIYSDHAAVGVDDSGASGTYYLHDNVKYYYCETTETGWEIGDRLPAGYNSAHIIDV